MLCFPNANINIGLNIIEKRSDHFHNIETVFYPVPLSDILEIVVNENPEDSDLDFRISGMSIPGEKKDNLCVKAYQILADQFPLPPVRILLHKIIPMGAGLGGGSSDGAHTLTLLNKIFQLGLVPEDLKMYATQLGSDCPFFIDNKPAIGLETGNNLSFVTVNLSGCYLVIIKPEINISTAEAYAGIIPGKPGRSLSEFIKLPINHWNGRIENHFEQVIFDHYPVIKEIKELLYRQGALYASMTGSGSAIYGIFEKQIQLKENFKKMFYWGGWL